MFTNQCTCTCTREEKSIPTRQYLHQGSTMEGNFRKNSEENQSKKRVRNRKVNSKPKSAFNQVDVQSHEHDYVHVFGGTDKLNHPGSKHLLEVNQKDPKNEYVKEKKKKQGATKVPEKN